MLTSTCKPNWTLNCSQSGELNSYLNVQGAQILGPETVHPPTIQRKWWRPCSWQCSWPGWPGKWNTLQVGGNPIVVFDKLQWSRSWMTSWDVFASSVKNHLGPSANCWIMSTTHSKALGGILRKCLIIVKPYLLVVWTIWLRRRNFCGSYI